MNIFHLKNIDRSGITYLKIGNWKHRSRDKIMKVYHIEGIRHCTVVFAETPEMAKMQAFEEGSVGEWEDPQAKEISPPHGYHITRKI